MSYTCSKTSAYLRVLVPNEVMEYIQAKGDEWGMSPELALREMAFTQIPQHVLDALPPKARPRKRAVVSNDHEAPAKAAPKPPSKAAKDVYSEVAHLHAKGLGATAIAAQMRLPHATIHAAILASKFAPQEV